MAVPAIFAVAGAEGSPIRAIGQVIKDHRSQFFVLWAFLLFEGPILNKFEPVISSDDSESFRRSGDPFSHPSGSSAFLEVFFIKSFRALRLSGAAFAPNLEFSRS